MSFLLGQAGLLIHLLDFLCIGIDNSFTWTILSLRMGKLFWVPLFFGAPSHGIPSTSSQNKLKSAVLKFRVCNLLLSFLRVLNSYFMVTTAKAITDYYISASSALLVNSRCSYVSSLFGSSSTYTCLHPALLPFWQITGKEKGPVRTRACDTETS